MSLFDYILHNSVIIRRIENKKKTRTELSFYNSKKNVTWFSFTTGLYCPRFVYSKADYENPHHNLSASLLGHIHFVFPWTNQNPKYKYGDDENSPAGSYGGYLSNDAHGGIPDTFCYYRYVPESKRRELIFKDFPWAYKHDGTYKMTKSNFWRLNPPEDEVYKLRRDFVYETKSGQIQRTFATVSLSKTIFTPKFAQKFDIFYFRKTCYSINIDFDEEVGEDVGTYKGGVVSISLPLDKSQNKIELIPTDVYLPILYNIVCTKIRREHDL